MLQGRNAIHDLLSRSCRTPFLSMVPGVRALGVPGSGRFAAPKRASGTSRGRLSTPAAARSARHAPCA